MLTAFSRGSRLFDTNLAVNMPATPPPHSIDHSGAAAYEGMHQSQGGQVCAGKGALASLACARIHQNMLVLRMFHAMLPTLPGAAQASTDES